MISPIDHFLELQSALGPVSKPKRSYSELTTLMTIAHPVSRLHRPKWGNPKSPAARTSPGFGVTVGNQP
jgi:hypothetical protein